MKENIDSILSKTNDILANFFKGLKRTFYDTEVKKTNTLFILAIILVVIFFFYRYESRNHIINGNSIKNKIEIFKDKI